VTAVDSEDGGGARITVRVPVELLRYVVEKGSVTVDGVSLTVAGIRGDAIELALIPHTLAVTTLGTARTGDPVNLEVDVIAKYVAKNVEELLGRSDR
jgi:riboflavin synthase